VVCALDLGPDEGIDLLVAFDLLAGLDLPPRYRSKAGCAKISRVRRTQARISVQSSGWLK